MFRRGISVLIALMIKRTIPSVLAGMLTNFFFWFIASVNSNYANSLGEDFANYLCLTPYKGSLVFLDKLLGIENNVAPSFVNSLQNSLSVDSFGVLSVFYACVFVIPTCIYFCRRFEIRE